MSAANADPENATTAAAITPRETSSPFTCTPPIPTPLFHTTQRGKWPVTGRNFRPDASGKISAAVANSPRGVQLSRSVEDGFERDPRPGRRTFAESEKSWTRRAISLRAAISPSTGRRLPPWAPPTTSAGNDRIWTLAHGDVVAEAAAISGHVGLRRPPRPSEPILRPLTSSRFFASRPNHPPMHTAVLRARRVRRRNRTCTDELSAIDFFHDFLASSLTTTRGNDAPARDRGRS